LHHPDQIDPLNAGVLAAQQQVQGFGNRDQAIDFVFKAAHQARMSRFLAGWARYNLSLGLLG
jgi:hypothetical protein